MLKYIFKRLLIFIPTLIAISLLTFIISVNAPGDPVDTILNKKQGESGQSAKNAVDETAYTAMRHKLGLDLPLFYFSITNATASDTLYRIPKADVRSNFEHISFIYGNWANTAHYYTVIKQFALTLALQPTTGPAAEAITQSKNYINSLKYIYEDNKVENVFQKLEYSIKSSSLLEPLTANLQALRNAWSNIIINRSPFQKYIPVIHWYGFHNQYHHWLVNFLRGDFGVSYEDMRPVSEVVWGAVKWTMGISFASIILAYLLAVPLGVGSAIGKGSKKEKIATTGLFMLYSLPNFWIATILIIFLCGGDWLSWFPAPGAAPIPEDAPFIYHITQGIYRLILPLFCWTYASLAFISRQMRGGMLNVIGQDYIRTAKAKGLSERTVIWKHALRNSLLPIITLFANVLPLIISGSVVIETIFSIPGMGQISYNALLANDYPVVFTDTMFAAILTLLGTLIADILYAVVDPRISFAKLIA
ncbi:MAG TPA: ABC transporter permease [Bacteroidia bacterium]|jgi:peptide/nickel transport system permease protein|nr:ABC transporter permease [Bacteroidia bacterium]